MLGGRRGQSHVPDRRDRKQRQFQKGDPVASVDCNLMAETILLSLGPAETESKVVIAMDGTNSPIEAGLHPIFYLGLAVRPVAPLKLRASGGTGAFLKLEGGSYGTLAETAGASWVGKPGRVTVTARHEEVVREGATPLPRGVRLIVLSRAEPPPAFARLRTHAELTFLGWEALRLTLEEAQGIAALRQEDAHRRSPAGIEQLHAQTQGWVAGLVLLLDQARLDDVTIAPVDETSQQVLFDYFAGELFERAAASTQSILLKTALLPRMSARMAEELTGDPESGRVLEELHRNNFFILRRAQTEAEYEYHPLFRDLLRARAQGTFAPERLSALRRQAAGILAGAGQTEEAVVLYHAAGDWASLIPLLVCEAPQLLAQGRHQMLAQWLTALPPETSEQHAWLCYWWIMARLPFDPPEARGHFERAYALFEGADDPAGLYLSLAGVVDSCTLVWHDFTPLDHWIAVLERLCARHPEPPSQAIEVRLCSTMTALNEIAHPEVMVHEIPPQLEALVRVRDGGQLGSGRVQPRGRAPDSAVGETGARAELIELLEPLRRLPAIAPLTRAQWCRLRAHYHLLRGEHQAQLEDATTGLAIAAESGVHVLDYLLLAHGAYAGLHAGDLPRAEASLREMRQAMVSPSPIALGHYQFLSALVGTAARRLCAGARACR
jgi:LuxR family transcriptional regulator, maltose regulon positive regulatory protein